MSAALPMKAEALALEIVEKFCNICNVEKQKSFRTRARGLITELYVNSAAYVVSICAARSSAEAVELGLTAKSPDDFLKVCGDRDSAKKLGLDKDDDFGYAVYGASLLYALKVFRILGSTRLSDALRELMENTLADRKAYRFATWLKRFAEAYIRE